MSILIILSGFAAGILSGMGMGGGTILIPILVLFFGIKQQVAQCTNLIFFIPAAIISLVVHFKSNLIDLKKSLIIIIFGLIGALIGSYAAVKLPSESLKKYFAIYLIVMGINELFRGNKRFIFEKS